MNHLLEFLLRQGDNSLVLGNRTSEWCGLAPAIEEDIALANTALDLIGQTQLWLGYAAELENKGRSANDLAFLRDAHELRNLLMLELPNGDFGYTIMRQFLFDAFQVPWLTSLSESSDKRIRDIANKSLKEAQYHLARSLETVIALGDGTEDSNTRMQTALDYLWSYAGEMFADDETDQIMKESEFAPLPSSIRHTWEKTVIETINHACLALPQSTFSHSGGRNGLRHTEHLGNMLAIMQILPRSYPEETW